MAIKAKIEDSSIGRSSTNVLVHLQWAQLRD